MAENTHNAPIMTPMGYVSTFCGIFLALAIAAYTSSVKYDKMVIEYEKELTKTRKITSSKLEGKIQEIIKLKDLDHDGKDEMALDGKIASGYNKDILVTYDGKNYFRLKFDGQGRISVMPYEAKPKSVLEK